MNYSWKVNTFWFQRVADAYIDRRIFQPRYPTHMSRCASMSTWSHSVSTSVVDKVVLWVIGELGTDLDHRRVTGGIVADWAARVLNLFNICESDPVLDNVALSASLLCHQLEQRDKKTRCWCQLLFDLSWLFWIEKHILELLQEERLACLQHLVDRLPVLLIYYFGELFTLRGLFNWRWKTQTRVLRARRISLLHSQ